jgi:hypothetical protein
MPRHCCYLTTFKSEMRQKITITCMHDSAKLCWIGDVSFQWERPIFEGPPTENPLDPLIPNFEKIATVPTSCYKPTFMTIAPRGSSAQYGEVAHFLLASFFFTSCHVPSLECAGRFQCLLPQTTSFATRKCVLGFC